MTTNGKKRKKEKSRRSSPIWLKHLLRLLNEDRQRNLAMLLLALCLASFAVFKGGGVPSHYSPGDVATRDIKAPRDLLVAEKNLTEKKRLEAERAVLPLYDFDPQVGKNIALRLKEALLILDREKSAPEEENAASAGSLDVLEIPLSEAELVHLRDSLPPGKGFEPLQKLFVQGYQTKVVGNLQLFEADSEKGIILRNLLNDQEAKVSHLQNVSSLEDVVGHIEKLLGGKANFRRLLPRPFCRSWKSWCGRISPLTRMKPKPVKRRPRKLSIRFSTRLKKGR